MLHYPFVIVEQLSLHSPGTVGGLGDPFGHSFVLTFAFSGDNLLGGQGL